MKPRTAADIMTQPVISALPAMRLTDVMALLLRWHISGMPVTDEQGALVGVITEHDLLNPALSGHANDTTVEEVMSRQIISFPPATRVEELVNAFVTRRLRRVPIVEAGKVAGIVSRRDILRELQRLYSGE